MEQQDLSSYEERFVADTSLPDKLPLWLEDMSDKNKESLPTHLFVSGIDMKTDLPSRLFSQDNYDDNFGDGFIKIAKGQHHEIRHGRRASQGALRSISKDRKKPLSRSADYATRRSSANSERRRPTVHHDQDQHLEQSWTSLSLFNQTQRGRLSAKNTPSSQMSNFKLFESTEEDLEDLTRTANMIDQLRITETNGGGDLTIEGRGIFTKCKEFEETHSENESSLSSRYSPTCNQFDDVMSVVSDVATPTESHIVPTEPITGQDKSLTAFDPSVQDDSFCIPELPKGKILEIVILDTWGDPHYVGLNGLEIFSSTGLPADIIEVAAEPSDINTLSGYSNDPRVPANLIDGVNLTRDDMHMWLAPFTPGKAHIVKLEFAEIIALALVRVWNYNKSRVHSYRGARLVEMQLDGVTIFKGEIARACGGDKGTPQAFGDTILFTTRDDILENVSRHDKCFALLCSTDTLLEPYFDAPLSSQLTYEAGSERPFTKARGPSMFDKNPSHRFEEVS